MEEKMESEMVERVAEAIAKSSSTVEWEKLTDYGVEVAISMHIDDAKAAIQAMREPSDAMCEAGDDGHYGMSSTEVWQAMIDAALSGKSGMGEG